MSAVRSFSYRFSPRFFRSHHGALLSSRFIAWAALLGTPLLGGLAIAMNYFRLPGYDNKVNGVLASVTGILSCCLMFSIVSTSPHPVVALIVLMIGSMWLAHATAFDCFASYYSGENQAKWVNDSAELSSETPAVDDAR